MKTPIHTKPKPVERWEMRVTGDDVAKWIDRAKLPPLDRQSAHDLAARISVWAEQWRDYSNHPEAKAERDTARNRRNRRIAAALATLQTDLPTFLADTAPNRPITFAGGFIEPLAYHVERTAPGFASALQHAGTERWHIIADDIERSLLFHYQEAPKTAAILCFMGDALASIGVNATKDAIRKRK